MQPQYGFPPQQPMGRPMPSQMNGGPPPFMNPGMEHMNPGMFQPAPDQHGQQAPPGMTMMPYPPHAIPHMNPGMMQGQAPPPQGPVRMSCACPERLT
jgi:hypothetical protein